MSVSARRLRVADLGTLLRKEHLVVIVAYFDESGTHADSKVFALGGYVGLQTRWIALESDWSRALSQYSISCFHMTDFENQHGEFERGWDDEEKRVSLIKTLIDIIESHKILQVVSSVDLEDYRVVQQDKTRKEVPSC